MSFSLDIKLVFIYSFQFSSSSLDTLGENDFNHLNLKLYRMRDKNEFYGSLRSKEINDKKHQHVLKV